MTDEWHNSTPKNEGKVSIMSPSLIARSVDTNGEENFPKGAAFSPDGLCVLTNTASDHQLRLYNTPTKQPEDFAENTNGKLLKEAII